MGELKFPNSGTHFFRNPFCTGERRLWKEDGELLSADPGDMAWKGRRQDLGDLTKEGVPDTSNPLVALISGVESSQMAIKPILATRSPGLCSLPCRARATSRRQSSPWL